MGRENKTQAATSTGSASGSAGSWVKVSVGQETSQLLRVYSDKETKSAVGDKGRSHQGGDFQQ